jgi:glycosyltransferase involved in cell wall biosynthesis
MNNHVLVPVTVVIPCFNSDKTIARAVHSVLSQTVLPSELIIVDDCSTDSGKTIQVIQALAEQARELIQVHVILKDKNGGPASSRNIGWDLAANSFIAFLDADDIWHPQKIEFHYQWMIDHPQAVLSGHGTSIYIDEKELKKINGTLNSTLVKPYQLLKSNPFRTRGVMLKKELPFRFPENMFHAEDFFLWSEITCANQSQCFLLDKVLSFSFKDDLSSEGLSGNLYAMEKGELAVIDFICGRMQYSFFLKYSAIVWSLIRYARRVFIRLIKVNRR